MDSPTSYSFSSLTADQKAQIRAEAEACAEGYGVMSAQTMNDEASRAYAVRCLMSGNESSCVLFCLTAIAQQQGWEEKCSTLSSREAQVREVEGRNFQVARETLDRFHNGYACTEDHPAYNLYNFFRQRATV